VSKKRWFFFATNSGKQKTAVFSLPGSQASKKQLLKPCPEFGTGKKRWFLV